MPFYERMSMYVRFISSERVLTSDYSDMISS